MIARLSGRLLEKQAHQVVVDVGGLGYRAYIPLSTYGSLPEVGETVSIRVHTYLREDLLALYGFSTRLEQDLFERLIDISGIGPRLALAILSGLPAPDLVQAIGDGDAGRLRGIPGIGPKTADRIVLEMRDRVRALEASAGAGPPVPRGDGELRRDALSALLNLGYREASAREAVERALRDGVAGATESARGLQDVLKRSLRYLTS